MVGDAIEPGRKARLTAEGWQPLPCRQESLLGDLAGLFVVLQHAQNHSEDAALVSLPEDGKGMLVPMLTGFHKLSVVLHGGLRNDAGERYLQRVCQLHVILVPHTWSCLPLLDRGFLKQVLRGLFFLNGHGSSARSVPSFVHSTSILTKQRYIKRSKNGAEEQRMVIDAALEER